MCLDASAGSMPDLKDALFVCKAAGKNNNKGTKDKPFKNIDKAAKKAKSGQTIAVCEGHYSGTFDVGYVEFKKAFKLYVSFSPDFSRRDMLKHATIFAPNNATIKNNVSVANRMAAVESYGTCRPNGHGPSAKLSYNVHNNVHNNVFGGNI